MFLDDEVGVGAGPQARQPRGEEFVEGGFADADRGVGPDRGESQCGVEGVGGREPGVGQGGGRGVGFGEFEGGGG
ncbi:hypothetical protein BJF79_46830 [Actinomadura sp. CNU-125]|nr:hypothetical protein BJF79_46830 [Actinomadura sp. CNU-125]